MMKELTYDEELVFSVIPEGKERAVLQRQISSKIGYSQRDIVKIVNSLRQKGYPICSTTYDGYWVATNKEEVLETMRALFAKEQTLAKTISNLSECLENME